jgi:hypothetical protein
VDNKGCSNPKEQYGDVLQLLLQWSYASGPAAGFDLWEWNMCMKHLGDSAVHWGVGTLMERFERAPPPGDFNMLEWAAFMHAIMREVQLVFPGPVVTTGKKLQLNPTQPQTTGLPVVVGPLQQHQPVAVGPPRALTQTCCNQHPYRAITTI